MLTMTTSTTANPTPIATIPYSGMGGSLSAGRETMAYKMRERERDKKLNNTRFLLLMTVYSREKGGILQVEGWFVV